MCFFIFRGGREEVRKRNNSTAVVPGLVASRAPPTGAGVCNLGVWPDWNGTRDLLVRRPVRRVIFFFYSMWFLMPLWESFVVFVNRVFQHCSGNVCCGNEPTQMQTGRAVVSRGSASISSVRNGKEGRKGGRFMWKREGYGWRFGLGGQKKRNWRSLTKTPPSRLVAICQNSVLTCGMAFVSLNIHSHPVCIHLHLPVAPRPWAD